MRSLLLVGATCIGMFSAGAALAQSAPAKPTGASWVGGYVGAAAAYSGVSNTTSDLKPSGFSGVALLGANLIQHSNMVLGIEGAAALFGSVKDGDASAGAAWSLSARAGYALGDIMPYASVGLGRAEGKYSGGTGRESTYFTSALVGGGVEGRINSSLNWRVEGFWSPALNAHELGGSAVKPSAMILRTGLTYKFY
jgi:hypothetical protein